MDCFSACLWLEDPMHSVRPHAVHTVFAVTHGMYVLRSTRLDYSGVRDVRVRNRSTRSTVQ